MAANTAIKLLKEKTVTTQINTDVRDDFFIALKYGKRNGKKGPSTGITLGRHWVFEWIFRSAWGRFTTGLATADWSKPQTAQYLYNDPDWTSMNFGVRIAIGRCLRFFVNHEMLPLKVINPHSTGTKLYMPINL